jgi:hypothetical protein
MAGSLPRAGGGRRAPSSRCGYPGAEARRVDIECGCHTNVTADEFSALRSTCRPARRNHEQRTAGCDSARQSSATTRSLPRRAVPSAAAVPSPLVVSSLLRAGPPCLPPSLTSSPGARHAPGRGAPVGWQPRARTGDPTGLQSRMNGCFVMLRPTSMRRRIWLSPLPARLRGLLGV